MSERRLELLQWYGLLGAPAAWLAQYVVGYFLSQARCEANGWSEGWAPTQLGLTCAAALVALLGEGASYLVVRALRDTDPDAPGPHGRQRLFAVAGLVGNVLFFVAIVLTGATVLATEPCVQA